MDNIILSSVIARITLFIRGVYSKSVLARFFTKTKELFLCSVVYSVFCAILSVPGTLPYSRTYKLLYKFNTFLFRIGDKVYPHWDKSLLKRLWVSFVHSKFVNQSLILSAIRSLGVRGILLISFGMYLPLDYFIRDVVKLSSLGSVWDEGLMLVGFGYVFWRIAFARNKTVKPRMTPVDAPLFLFIAVALLVMVMVSPVMGVAIAGYRAVCQFMLWFFVITRLIEDDRDLKLLFYSVCAMGLCVGLHGVYQYIIGAPMPSTWVAAAETTNMRTRIYSITGSPNVMGSLMVMCAPLFAALAYYAKPLWAKILAWGATGIVCLAVILTFSRGAWFGLAVAVVMFCLLVDIRLLAVAGAAVGGLILFVPAIGDRIGFLFTSDFAAANNKGGRGERWAIGLTLLETSPVWGFGLGRFGGAIAMQNQSIEGLDYFYMDNYYLKTLVEMGYVGLTFYILLLALNAFSTLRGLYRAKKTKLRLLAAGMFSGMVGVLAHSYFENIFEVPYMNAYFWGLAAAIMYICFLRKRKA